MKRAFKNVYTEFLALISVNIGQLKCDNCEYPKLPKNFHNGQDIKQAFKIERIDKYPAISFVNDEISSQTYVEISKGIIAS